MIRSTLFTFTRHTMGRVRRRTSTKQRSMMLVVRSFLHRCRGKLKNDSSCGKSAINTNTPCLNYNAFFDSFNNLLTAIPNQTRNQFRGASYFNMDMGLFRNFQIKERLNLAVGMMAYNVFNHANMPFHNNSYSFYDPKSGPPNSFGTINAGPGVGTPTSPYGNFLGFDSSPRIVQLSAKITF